MTDRTIDWVFRATDRTGAAFRSIDSKLAGITKSLRSFAGFAGFATVAAGIGTLTKGVIQMADELQDASEKLGISAEQLQVLKFAAEQTGSSFDSLQAALVYNTKLTGEATRGSKAAAEAFRLLGLDAQKFAELPIDRRLIVIARQLSQVQDKSLQVQLAVKAFGRSASDLVPLLSQGETGIAQFDRQLRATGSILSNEQVPALAEAADKWDALILRFQVAVAGPLTSLVGWLSDAADVTGRFADNVERVVDAIPQIRLPNQEKFRTQLGRGATGRWEAPGDTGAVIGAAGLAQSDAQIAAQAAAAEKALAATARAQAAVAKEAAAHAGEVQKLVEGIADLSSAAAGTFDDRIAELTEQYRTPLDTLRDKILEINQLVSLGLDSETANRAIQDYADTYARSLDVVKDKNTEVKDSTQAMLESLKLSTDGFAKDLTDAFFDATNSIGDYFEQLAVTIAKALFTQSISEPLIKGILRSFGSGLDLGSLFGGARAMGGPVASGSAYLVGERGPELFVPNSSGRIVPNGEATAPVVNVNFSISSIDPQTAAQTIAGQERLITGMIRRATMRAGQRPVLA